MRDFKVRPIEGITDRPDTAIFGRCADGCDWSGELSDCESEQVKESYESFDSYEQHYCPECGEPVHYECPGDAVNYIRQLRKKSTRREKAL